MSHLRALELHEEQVAEVAAGTLPMVKVQAHDSGAVNSLAGPFFFCHCHCMDLQSNMNSHHYHSMNIFSNQSHVLFVLYAVVCQSSTTFGSN
jgi:hypothetical protein